MRAAFLDWLLKEIQALPVPARQAAATEGTVLEATSATALLPADQDDYRELKAFRLVDGHNSNAFSAFLDDGSRRVSGSLYSELRVA